MRLHRVAKRLPSLPELAGAVPYAAAAVLYIAIGVCCTDFLLSAYVAMAYLLVVAWLVPAAVRRLR